MIVVVGAYLALARNAPDHRPRHTFYFVVGTIVIWVALESPLDWYGDHALQSAHMVQHVLIGLIAPPLWLLGLSASMAARLLGRPRLRAFAEPVPAQIVMAVVMIAWHFPRLYDLTLASEAVHVFEHLTFIFAGVLFWSPVVDATSQRLRWRLGPVGKVVYLLAGTAAQDLVSLVLIFSRVPFYSFYRTVPHSVSGTDALTDQTLAGIALFFAGKISYAVAMLKLVVDWMARSRAQEGSEEGSEEGSVAGSG